jgi:N-acetylneuraminate synthase
MTSAFEVGGRAIGPSEPVFVIAELSANHGQRLARALELVDLAADAGADAIKLQTYTPETMTFSGSASPFVVGPGTPWEGRQLAELYREAMTPWEWYPDLAAAASRRGLVLFSTPFDATAVDFLVAHDTPAFKIASFELVDLGLIEQAAATGRPLIMSTGMATADEIDRAVATATGAGSGQVALLRCNSAYPASPDEMDLRTIPDMASRWQLPIGLSDHTLGTTAVTAAVAMGACIVEKHVTVRRDDGGPDAAFSLEPDEFAAMVRAVRETEAVLGSVRYGPSPAEEPSRAFRRSIFVVTDVRAGERITEEHLRMLRPAAGLPPLELPTVLGRIARVDIAAGTPLQWDLLD